jgi:integrase
MKAKVLQFPGAEALTQRIKRKRGSNKGYQIKSRGKSHTVVIRLREGKDTKTFPTLELATEWAIKRVNDIKYGRTDTIRNKKLKEHTLRDVIEHCIAYVKANEWIGSRERHRAWQEDADLLKRFMNNHPWLVDKRLDVITADDWQRQQSDRLNGANGIRKISGDTWNREATAIRYVLYYYARKVHPDRLLIPDWFKELETVKQKTLRKNHVLTDAEFRRIQDAILTCPYRIVNEQYTLMLHWLYESCVRRGAIVQIKWKHIDWKGSGYTQLGEKYSEERYIPLSLAFMKRLERYRDAMPEPMRKPEAYVFWNSRSKRRYGLPYRKGQISQTFAEYFAKAGFQNTSDNPREGFCLHMIRHSAMHRYETMGMVPSDIEYLAGHKLGSSRAVGTYWHENVKRIRDVIDPGWRDRPAMSQWFPNSKDLPPLTPDQESFRRLIGTQVKGKMLTDNVAQGKYGPIGVVPENGEWTEADWEAHKNAKAVPVLVSIDKVTGEIVDVKRVITNATPEKALGRITDDGRMHYFFDPMKDPTEQLNDALNHPEEV